MTAIKRRKPLRRISARRSRERLIYLKLRADYLAMNPICQCCDKRQATDIHHRAGRGKNYLAVETFMSCCRFCHTQIHQNPSLSRQLGYLI